MKNHLLRTIMAAGLLISVLPSAALAADDATEAAVGRVLTVNSTGYCLNGIMADGKRTHPGVVAMAHYRFGAKFKVLSGPMAGHIYTVEDRPDSHTQFDIWFGSAPGRGNCAAALRYGRHTIRVQRIG